MGGGTRRFHHKSRNGCGQCKAKHIRCDLQAPICSNCDKKGLRCDYLDLDTQRHVPTHGASSSPLSSAAAFAASGSPPAHRSRTHAHQNARGQYSVLTFRVNRAAGLPRKASRDEQHPDDHETTLLSPRLCPRLEPATAHDNLIAHWLAFTAPSVPLRDSSTSSRIWKHGIALTPLVRGGPYVVEALRCVALLHINYLRTSNASTPPTASLEPSSSQSMSDGRRKPGIVFHDLENPDILQACTHLGNAISEFRSEVKSINHGNWLACIAFALAIIIYNFDHARRAPPNDFQTIVVDTLKAMRSAFTMRSSVVPLTRSSEFPLMSTGDSSHTSRKQEDADSAAFSKEAKIREDTLERIDSLLQKLMWATGHYVDPPDIQYKDYQKFMLGMTNDQLPASLDVVDSRLLAALALRTWARNIDAWPRSWLDVMFWPWCLPPEFLNLLEAKDPISLVILIHWFALIDRVSNRWFLDGWARRGIAVSVQALGSEWDALVSWPKAQVGLT